ncbi:low-density lipoprotein receptor-related protein 10 [Electrophorus electricus]|uniref:CUB domain-containing protein n=1 Tax=Electrophorus electricus TaxID=8005 RepID=A0A4W4EIG2_ELEEL|nr:low-density lipoprotein receptor-related protein 10 [Electrophorus electricus]
MDALYSLSIFSLLIFTAHCRLGQAFSWDYCGKSSKILRARQGEIHSSSLHGPPGPINCTWVIMSSVGERVVLSFSELDIRCGQGNRVWLTVASLTDKPVPICGTLPKPVELYGGNITVTHHFVPHFSISGFRLSYIKDSGPCHPGEFECYSDRCLPASWRCNGQVECLGEGDELGSDEDGCDFEPQPHPGDDPSVVPTSMPAASSMGTDRRPRRDPELHVQSQGGPCGGYLQAFYGSFVPPVPTGAPMECVWTVDPQDPRPLKLGLQQLELGSGDSLIITDQPGGAGNIIKTITCTSNYKTVEVESQTGLLSLTYNMQARSEGQGFNATYRIADYCLPWEGPCKGSEGGCFTQKQRCDGHWDCAETGVDEVGCGGCPAGHFPCGPLAMQRVSHLTSRPVCFSIHERCNYQLNCADGSDERECTICQPGTFHCDSDRCVFESWRCDGQVDCKDGTDELNCTMTLPRKVITAATVGSLVCGLLLVIAMGCTCKLYSLRTREYSLFAPISRQEAELIQQQAPPSYGQLIAQGIIPPVEDFPTENPNEPTSLSLRGLLQLIRQDNIASPRRRRRPRFVRRAIRRLRRWGVISRPASRSTQSTSSNSQQTDDTPTGQESSHSEDGDSSSAREPANQLLPQKMALSQQAEQEQQTEAPLPPPPQSTPPPSLQSVAAPETPRSSPVATPPRSPSLASLFHSLGLSISLFRPSSSPTALSLSASPSFSSSSSDDEVLLIPLSDDGTSDDDVPMLT